MVLNMLSSGTMTRLGYVYDNLMVNVRLNNEKLVERGITILERATGADREKAKAALQSAGNHVPTALLMLETGCNRVAAKGALKKAAGNVREAMANLRSRAQ